MSAGFAQEGIRRGANLHDDRWHDMTLDPHLATDVANAGGAIA